MLLLNGHLQLQESPNHVILLSFKYAPEVLSFEGSVGLLPANVSQGFR